MRFSSHAAILAALCAGAAFALFSGCGQSGSGSGFGDEADGSSDGADDVPPLGTQDDGGHLIYDDFPQPIVDGPDGGGGPVPANAPTLFGPPSQGGQSGGPCLVEPEIGALYPRNWLRPRFVWKAPGGQNLFELRIHAPNEKEDLLVYTAATSWTMPQSVWDLLRSHTQDVPLTVSIRGGVLAGTALSGVALGSTGPLGVAPADAPGTIVYWTSSNGTALKGFQVGDETVSTTLLTSQVQETPLGGDNCIGCHSGAPDGDYSVFATDVNTWGNAAAVINPDAGAVGAAPSFLGAGARQTFAAGPLGINALSKAHWSAGDRMMIASDGSGLVWVDLEAATLGTARGTIARNGTQTGGGLAGAPTWSHDGATIVYVATDHLITGRLGGDSAKTADPGATADLFSVPYNGRQGGTIAPVAGATAPDAQEYYPAFSPDDAFLAFDRCENDLNMYNQPRAEVFVIPKAGGTATRLAANDPPACSGATSPGVTNSWPKWAPAVTQLADGRSFYWLVFSSTRRGANPQLFVSAIVVDKSGAVTTHSALYLWNQPNAEGNHTPAWEFFNVPTPPSGPPK